METPPIYTAAAKLIAQADSMIIIAGAGMGVDPGLTDSDDASLFLDRYPAFRGPRTPLDQVSSPNTFMTSPRTAWGFYGQRLSACRQARANTGFHVLRRIAAALPDEAFVVTSNVDGLFLKTGFPDSRVLESRGSIHYLQCLHACNDSVWSANSLNPVVDLPTCRLVNEPPHCERCGEIARPNVLMANDWEWVESRAEAQQEALTKWLDTVQNPVLIEIMPLVPHPGEQTFIASLRGPRIRILNDRLAVPESSDELVCVPAPAVKALHGIERALRAMSFL